ncbi:hypothetical protein BHE74_00009501 [Ensete ventricosum]|nr:hypothetical protein GW17_00012724 [Ensete ventricosum]RWW82057.1 hypothetical protein BHE74_00009501 [Ensete ventricosum]
MARGYPQSLGSDLLRFPSFADRTELLLMIGSFGSGVSRFSFGGVSRRRRSCLRNSSKGIVMVGRLVVGGRAMLADVGREGACVPSSPSPHAAVMPSRQMTKEIKGVKPVVSKKQPLNNSMNQQKLENGCLPHDIKNVRRRRGRGRTKAVEREVKQEVEVGLETVAPPVSSKGVVFCRRPGFGQAGTRCIVKANHFLAELPDKDLNQYDVSVTITPEVSSRSTNRAIIAEFVRLYRETELGMRLPAYDGRKSLYTAGSLPFNSKEFTIKLLEEDGGITRKPQRLGDGLQSWCGFYQSIRPTQMGLSLNIDMSCTAFIDPLPVVEFVAQILGKDVSSRPLSDADRIKVFFQK